ncbi:MAG: hypothetical protein D8G53_09505 [Candidatus Saccharimonas sp.]|nr:MAG: hypothetical protein D8G53_09505 [Candidatus Saccharimonas sp.]
MLLIVVHLLLYFFLVNKRTAIAGCLDPQQGFIPIAFSKWLPIFGIKMSLAVNLDTTHDIGNRKFSKEINTN